uniref:Nucleotide-diphospho-sugar transferase domain-containing protein n=1 Tax=viral metagenome TaxID=1070528 RepID=A0A6C0E598_9ZZZZ
MFNELQNLPENVVKNPEIINKQRFHGSLLHGIYSNMIYALDHYTFDYFLILSSRTILYRNVNEPDLIKDELHSTEFNICQTDVNTWWWPHFLDTLLAKRFLTTGALYRSPHEGLCFRHDVILKIHQFLSDNPEITQDLIVYPGAVEEFAIQTIAEGDFLYLGNGVYNDVDLSDPNKYTCKINMFDVPT